MLSFAAIKTEVTARLGNRTDIASRVDRWINYAWFELLLNPRFAFFELDVVLDPFTVTVPGTATYIVPTDLWFILDLTDTTNSRKIDRVSFQMIDNQFPTSGQPVRYYRFSNTLTFDPVPDLAYDIKLRYRKRPNDLGTASNLLIGTEWEELIVSLSVKKGYDALGSKDAAAAELQLVEQMMQTRYDVPNLEDADSEPTLQPRMM